MFLDFVRAGGSLRLVELGLSVGPSWRDNLVRGSLNRPPCRLASEGGKPCIRELGNLVAVRWALGSLAISWRSHRTKLAIPSDKVEGRFARS